MMTLLYRFYRKFLLIVKATADEIKFRTKVLAKGQITLPSDIQKEIGIRKGDEILLIKKMEE